MPFKTRHNERIIYVHHINCFRHFVAYFKRWTLTVILIRPWKSMRTLKKDGKYILSKSSKYLFA